MLVEYDSGRSCVMPQRKGMKTDGSDRCREMGSFSTKAYRRISRAFASASSGTVLLLLSLIHVAAGQMQPDSQRSNPAAFGLTQVLGLQTSGAESAGIAGRGSPEPMAPAAEPVITSPLAMMATVGQPFTYQFEATGAVSLEVTGLPEGLQFDPSISAIVGTPAIDGTYQVGLIAFGPDGSLTSETLMLTIQPPTRSGPIIISSTSATGRTGSPFSFQVVTSGTSAAARLSTAGLPTGLSADSVTGIISGTPAKDGSTGRRPNSDRWDAGRHWQSPVDL